MSEGTMITGQMSAPVMKSMVWGFLDDECDIVRAYERPKPLKSHDVIPVERVQFTV